MTRLIRFRELIRTLDPTRTHVPTEAVIEPARAHDAVPRVANEIELNPNASHLLLGMIGSGKTTTARRIVQRVRAAAEGTSDIVAYVDVSSRHLLDEGRLRGVLLAIAGVEVSRRIQRTASVTPELTRAARVIREFAEGKWVPDPSFYAYDEPPDDPDDYEQPEPEVFQEGVLRPPPREDSVHIALASAFDALATIRGIDADAHVTFAFDSLDRLRDPKRFSDALRDDIVAMRAARIGHVIVGPMRFALGTDTTVRDLFGENIHVLRVPDPADESDRLFLVEVLAKRDANALIGPAEAQSIASWSGGLLRDLLGIAYRAAQEAYARGADRIELADVEQAALARGDALAFGLDDDGRGALARVAASGEFAIFGERELSLVDSGRVIPRGNRAWAVHPCLASVLWNGGVAS